MSDLLAGLSPKARGKVWAALRSDEATTLVTDVIESRSEGKLSRHECVVIAMGVLAALAGGDR